MAGYWPSSFFCVFMDRDGVRVDKLAKVAVKVAVDPLGYRLVHPQLL